MPSDMPARISRERSPARASRWRGDHVLEALPRIEQRGIAPQRLAHVRGQPARVAAGGRHEGVGGVGEQGEEHEARGAGAPTSNGVISARTRCRGRCARPELRVVARTFGPRSFPRVDGTHEGCACRERCRVAIDWELTGGGAQRPEAGGREEPGG